MVDHPDIGTKITAAKTGKYLGEKAPNWQGGISFEPYCPKFNNEFKERVRAYFGYQCVECGTPQGLVKLTVHHVSYNKNVCCDSAYPLFVALCSSCHSKTGRHREYWEEHFKEMIDEFYEGKCYFSRDEMKNFESTLK